ASLESIQLTKTLGNDVALASALAWLALVEAGLGRSDDARAHGATSLQVTQSRGDRFNEVRARGGLGHEALARGEVAAAVEWLEISWEPRSRHSGGLARGPGQSGRGRSFERRASTFAAGGRERTSS